MFLFSDSDKRRIDNPKKRHLKKKMMLKKRMRYERISTDQDEPFVANGEHSPARNHVGSVNLSGSGDEADNNNNSVRCKSLKDLLLTKLPNVSADIDSPLMLVNRRLSEGLSFYILNLDSNFECFPDASSGTKSKAENNSIGNFGEDNSEDEIINVDDYVPSNPIIVEQPQREEMDLSVKSSTKFDYFTESLNSVIRHTPKHFTNGSGKESNEDFVANDLLKPLADVPFLRSDSKDLLCGVEAADAVAARMQIMSQIMNIPAQSPSSMARALAASTLASLQGKSQQPQQQPPLLDETFLANLHNTDLSSVVSAASFPFNSSLFAAAASAAAAVVHNNTTNNCSGSEKRGRGRPPKYGKVSEPNSIPSKTRA